MATDPASEVFALIDGLSKYYSDNDTFWSKVPEMSWEELRYELNKLEVQEMVSGFTVTKDVAIDGSVLGYDATGVIVKDRPEIVFPDSNLNDGLYSTDNTFTGKIPMDSETTQAGNIKTSTGAKSVLTGSTVATVADRIGLAVAGVNIGAKLGKDIASGLYQSDPNFWDNVLPDLNPQKWSYLCGRSDIGDYFLRTLFGVTEDQTGIIGYVPEDLLAYYYQTMRDNAFFAEGSRVSNVDDVPDSFPQAIKDAAPIYSTSNPTVKFQWTMRNVNTGVEKIKTWTPTYDGANPLIASIPRIKDMGDYVAMNVGYAVEGTYFTYDNKSVGNWSSRGSNAWKSESGGWQMITPPVCETCTANDSFPAQAVQFAWVVAYGFTETGGHEGVSNLPNSTQYPPTNITGTTPDEVLQQLKQEYPDLFDGAITTTTPQPDGTNRHTTYIPIPWVTDSLQNDTATTGDGKTQSDTKLDPNIIEQILQQLEPGQPTTPPDTGTGSTPTVVVPVGSASSLWAVYNPTQGELNSFGSWLWSSNFVEQIKKLFADPMQAILGVHKVFATPHTGGSQSIKCGYLDSGVSASVVTNQYTEIDCGSASLNEYFGNVFDYDPFTKVSIFLPFIGIVPLNTAEVMRSNISVKYTVDVITGACLAEVKISRDGENAVLYTYAGSAIVSYPVSSGSYVGVIGAAVSTALGIGSAIATGGASALASAGMVVNGISHAKTQVQHSGQFTGASGAMGGKSPYLIVIRPQTRTPSQINFFEGIPSNEYSLVGNCSGFIRVKDVHLSIPRAMNSELQEIENLLKTGVII